MKTYMDTHVYVIVWLHEGHFPAYIPSYTW